MNTLLEQTLDFDNLCSAWNEVEQNKGIPGVDNISIKRWRRNWEERLMNLIQDIQHNNYEPKSFRTRHIPNKNKFGWRTIQIPTVTDRVIQRAALQVLHPIYENKFYDCSYGYRPNRGLMDAIRKIVCLREQGCIWVLDADIDDFFANVDHHLLLEFLSEDLPDQSLFPLIKLWLHQMETDRDRQIGIPIGSPVSPMFANLLLHRLDHSLFYLGYEVIRYADDFCIFSRDEEGVQQAYVDCERILDGLNLQFEPNKTNITNFQQGFSFLGVWFEGDTYEYVWKRKRIIVEGDHIDRLFNFYGPDY